MGGDWVDDDSEASGLLHFLVLHRQYRTTFTQPWRKFTRMSNDAPAGSGSAVTNSTTAAEPQASTAAAELVATPAQPQQSRPALVGKAQQDTAAPETSPVLDDNAPLVKAKADAKAKARSKKKPPRVAAGCSGKGHRSTSVAVVAVALVAVQQRTQRRTRRRS